MVKATIPNNEIERLKALERYKLLDTLPEEDFDRITYLASLICQTPISLISLIDKNRQYFKSHLGVEICETNRDLSFCAHAINQAESIFEIEDLRLDKRFHDNDFVTGQPNVVFYAGVPLVTNDGFALGTLCVIDTKPRKLSHEQKEGLDKLSKQVMNILDARQKQAIEQSFKLIDFTFNNSSMPIYLVKEDSSIYDLNDAACEGIGCKKEELLSKKIIDIDTNFNAESWANHWAEIKAKGKLTIETSPTRKDGTKLHAIVSTHYLKQGDTELICSYITDITEKKKQEEQMKLVDFAFRNTKTPVHIINKDATLFDFNEAAYQTLGYTKEEYKTITIPDIDPNYQQSVWPSHWEELKKAGSLKFESILKKKNGELINAYIEATFIKYGDQELNYTFLTDITEKKKLEQQMKLLDYSFKNTSTAIFLILEDGLFLDFNEATANLLGYCYEEFIGKTIMDVNPIVTKEFWTKRWQDLIDKPNQTVYTKFKKKDQSLIDVEIKTSVITLGDVTVNFGFFTDITDKLKAEKELERSIQRYQYATIATSDVIWEADLIKQEVFISKNFTSFYGHQVDDGMAPMENNIWRQNIHPDELEEVLKKQYNILSPNNLNDNWVGEYRLRKADGNYATVIDKAFAIRDAQGTVVKMVGALQDITAKKEEEARLKLMESVILNTNDSIMITEAEPLDLPGPRILYVNKAFTEMTGYTAEEVIGNTPRIFQNEDTDRKELDKLYHALKNWESCEVTVSNFRKNGEKFWLNMRITPIANEKGWFTHWIAIERDVTKEKEAEQEKQKLLEELLQNNLELKQFSYITSHNLRSPLMNLLSICELIKPENITDKLTAKLIEGFKKSTYNLNDTLNDLIEILIIKENRNVQTTQLSFEDIFSKIMDSLSLSLSDKKVSVKADFSKAPFVNFTNAYLESILLNLFTNSIKYRHPDRDPEINIKTVREKNGKTKLIFSDNGIGINMAIAKDKIFGLYKRFHKNADSKGIGLYLIHSQITALGGNIEVESEVNIGTTFTITFK